MKKLIILFCLFAFCNVHAQIGIKLKVDAKVSDNIKLLLDYISTIKTDAINQGDYVLQKNISDLSFYLESLLNNAGNVLDHSLDKGDRIIKENLYKIQDILNNTIGIVKDTDIAVKTTIQDICNKFRLLCNEKDNSFMLSYINGQVVNFIHDDYFLKFGGSALNLQNKANLFLNVKNNWVALKMITSSVNEVKFLIPFELIKDQFSDVSTVKMNYKLEITKLSNNKTVLNHQNFILLLPKYPFKVEILEKFETDSLVSDPSFKYKEVITQNKPLRGQQTIVNKSVPLQENEVFRSIEFDPKYVFIGGAFLATEINRWFSYFITCTADLSEGGRVVNLSSRVKINEEDVHSTKRAEFDEKVRKYYAKDQSGSNLQINVDVFFFKKEKVLKTSLLDLDSGNAEKLLLKFGSNFSNKLKNNHKNYIIKLTRNGFDSRGENIYYLYSDQNMLDLNSIRIKSSIVNDKILISLINKI